MHVLANGIGFEGLLILGCLFFVLPAAFVVLGEAVVLKVATRRTFRWSVGTAAVGNFWSAMAGIPLYVLFAGIFPQLPTDLHVYFAAVFLFGVVRYAVYFGMSFGLEYAIARWRRGAVATPRLALGVLAANLLTYGVLSPVHYLATRPEQNLAVLVGDTAWSADGTTAIFYIDQTTGHLVRTDPRREKTETIVPHAMTEYQFTADLRVVVFLRGEALFRYEREGGKLEALGKVAPVWRTGLGYTTMATVALSPSGDRVAYTPAKKQRDGRPAPELVPEIFDAPSGRTVPLFQLGEFEGDACALVWASEQRILYRQGWEVKGERVLSDDLARSTPAPLPAEIAPNGVFGTFGSHARRWGPHWQTAADDDDGEVFASANNFLSSQFVHIGRGGYWPEGPEGGKIRIADNGGFPGLSKRRRFRDVAVIPGSGLCVLEDETFSTLYLVDQNTRTLGKLAAGRGVVLLTPKYQGTRLFREVKE